MLLNVDFKKKDPKVAEALIKMAQEAIDLARSYAIDPFLIENGTVSVEFFPPDDQDDRINISKKGHGYTCVNYTDEGVTVDTFDEAGLNPVHTRSVPNDVLNLTEEER